jgi:carbon catabolite-derepressing protein kinase
MGGKYELIKLIGQGMTSKVFMVRLTADHSQILALKVITNSYWNKRREYIENEIKVLSLMRGHPNIIELKEQGRASFLDTAGDEWGQNYLIFEYPRGGHLIGMLMDMDPLGIDAARFLIKQLILAVEALHNKNICHRDLKPENVMMDSLLNLKLIDFGLSNNLSKSLPSLEGLTTFAGTP